MKFEQLELPILNPEETEKQQVINKKEDFPVPADDLDFDCEYCMDRAGGCPQCGFGSKRG